MVWLIVFAGWDPIFEFEGKTYAEMDKAAKVDKVLFSPVLSRVV